MTLRVAGKVRAADRWTAPSELRKRLLAAFQANGIEIPVRGQVARSARPAASGSRQRAIGSASGGAGGLSGGSWLAAGPAA